MLMFTKRCPHSLTERVYILGGDSSKRAIFLTPHNHSGDAPTLSIDFDRTGNENITFMDLAELNEFITALTLCRTAMENEENYLSPNQD